MIGKFLARQQRDEEALEHFRRAAAKSDWRAPFFLRELGIAHARLGQYESAEDALGRALILLSGRGDERLRAQIERELARVTALAARQSRP